MRYIYTWYCQDNDGVNDQSDIVWHTSSNRWQSIWCTNDIPFHNKWGYMVGYCHYMRYSITWIPRTYCVDSQFLQRRYKYQSMVRVEHRFWADPLSYLDYFMVNFNFYEFSNKVLIWKTFWLLYNLLNLNFSLFQARNTSMSRKRKIRKELSPINGSKLLAGV